MEWYVYMWLAAIIIFSVIEATGVNLVSIWFALGALAAFLAALLGAPFWLQIVIFVVVSAVSLAATRPLAKRFLSRRGPATNSDRNIGQTAICTERIENELDHGTVRLMGKEWRARTANGETVEPGASVQVEAINGVTLLVAPVALPAQRPMETTGTK